MRKLRVFVSSAVAELEYEREAAIEVIQALGLEPVVFEIFPPMSTYLDEAYLTAVQESDLFVMILWKDLREPVLREYEAAIARSKPVLMMVKLLKSGEQRSPRLKKFLGLTLTSHIAANRALVPYFKEYRRLEELRQYLRDGIIGQITAAAARQPITTHTRQEMYELGTDIARSAKKRLCVAQATPSLFFGPRNYQYEIDFYQELYSWVQQAAGDHSRRFTMLFDLESTITAIAAPGVDRGTVQKRITDIAAIAKGSNRNIRIHPAPPHASGPIELGDDWFAFWLAGTDNAICISYVNAKLADLLSQFFGELTSEPLDATDLPRLLHLTE